MNKALFTSGFSLISMKKSNLVFKTYVVRLNLSISIRSNINSNEFTAFVLITIERIAKARKNRIDIFIKSLNLSLILKIQQFNDANAIAIESGMLIAYIVSFCFAVDKIFINVFQSLNCNRTSTISAWILFYSAKQSIN